MFAVTERCGWCGERGRFRFAHAFGFTPTDPDEEDARAREGEPGAFLLRAERQEPGATVEGAAVAQCSHCNRPALFVFDARRRHLGNIVRGLEAPEGLLGGETLVRVKGVWPPQPEAEQDPHWPREILRHFKDAQDMLTANISPSIIIATCRTVLDVVTKKLGAAEGNLARRIDVLREKAQITLPIADWAHSLRLDGNTAVHEAEGDAAAAREYVEFLRVLLNITFTLPARIAEKRQVA